MGNIRFYSVVLAAAVCCLPLYAQEYEGNAAAKAAFELGQKAHDSGNYAAAIADYKKAIALDPDFVKAHEQYIFTHELELVMPQIMLMESGKKPTPQQNKKWKAELEKLNRSMIHEYETLAKQHPDKAVYPWALGQLYNESNPLQQEKYCQQAVHIDPKFFPGYQCLSAIANLRGDEKQAIELQRKVVELEPNNAEEAFSYSYMLRNDPVAYKVATTQFVKKFPDSPKAAQALYWYAKNQKSDAAKIAGFEQLCKQFPPAKFDWSDEGATNLFGIFDHTEPEKAQTLAQEMLKANPKDKNWMAYAAYADTMAKAEQEIQENNPTAAMSTLQQVKSPSRRFDMRRKVLLEARALDLSGKTAQAYSMLLSNYAKHPTDEIRTALNDYGTKLGETSQQTDVAIWSEVKANSTPAIPFSLHNFTNGKLVSLASYKGHVVILDFWYPNCGPCRAAFPYLQQVASKYKDKGVPVFAINTIEGQQAFVLPFLKSKGYDFIPLKGNQKWVSDVYHVNGTPATFIIGADGREYFRPHVYDQAEARTTELEVDELLTHSGQ